MTRPPAPGAELLAWYTKKARPLLEQHAAPSLAALDEQKIIAERLLVDAEQEVAICFLGAAGVGKSTLLNALVSEKYNVLPHGGVGPLTAQATIVRHSAEPYFRATYFSAQEVNKLLFTIERAHERALKSPASRGEDLAMPLDEDDRAEVEGALVVDEDGTPAEGARDKLDAWKHEARLLIQGRQEGEIDVPYLCDALRLVLGLQPRWERAPRQEDVTRIERLRECLLLARGEGFHRERHADGNMKEFLAELRDHASGFLAPIICELHVGWDAEILRDGTILVDLPGVGVANDRHGNVTADWIRTKARAIALVVDRAGITEATAQLLRQTGFLARLLLGGDEPGQDPVSLAAIMVKIDLSADSAWQDELDLDENSAQPWGDHFRRFRGDAVELMKQQMRRELDKLAAAAPEAIRPERAAALARVLDTLQVHAVSAPQFRAFHAQRKEAPPRIADVEESGIPAVRRDLHGLAAAHRRRLQERAEQALTDFRASAGSAVKLIQAQWEADERAEREAEQLRADLEIVLLPKQRELDGRRGAFREFLQTTVPTLIEGQVKEAAHIARDDIRSYLRGLRDLSWATLAATVRKGGAHVSAKGLHIDLPNELALRFEEPVAIVWSKHVLTALRRRTADLGRDYVAIVGEVVDWARSQEARVKPKVVEALHENLAAQTKDLASVGKEAVNELKGKIKAQLYQELVKKVRRRCESFVARNYNQGSGVKGRILEMYADLADEVVDIARPITTGILVGNYREVEAEITQRFAAYANPLDSARDAIVRSHEDSVRRSDAQRRRRVLEEIDAVLDAMPRPAGGKRGKGAE